MDRRGPDRERRRRDHYASWEQDRPCREEVNLICLSNLSPGSSVACNLQILYDHRTIHA
jgi:hypothetical protein